MPKVSQLLEFKPNFILSLILSRKLYLDGCTVFVLRNFENCTLTVDGSKNTTFPEHSASILLNSRY